MLLVVGLGNPGDRYKRNRHNIGWMAVDSILAEHGFGPERRRFQGLVSEGRLAGRRATTLKPTTSMNISGQSVSAAMRYFRLAPGDVVVFHDELDLIPGKVRAKQGGGNAGHRGLISIDAHIGKDYRRVRLGIGHPGDKARVNRHVLGDFAKSDAGWRDALLDAVAAAAPMLATGDDTGFQNKVAMLAPAPKQAES
ncbi:MAG: aminoacyl-tRNA hydrolase [Alphaproteobacteria bacterium]|nr:aminoacyl-tRNA hydrolase [Alphaproteobacteria bacterium]